MVTCYLMPKNFDANAIPNSILRYDGKEDKNDRSDSQRQRTEERAQRARKDIKSRNAPATK